LIFIRSTGQFVVIVGGLGAEGTEAASEVVSNPVYISLLLSAAPKNWQSMNLKAVISTKVIHGEPGPPNVVATPSGSGAAKQNVEVTPLDSYYRSYADRAGLQLECAAGDADEIRRGVQELAIVLQAPATV